MFDVVIPTYNSNPEFLKKAVDSVLNQTYQNFEIYICDGTPTNLPNNAQETLKHYSDKRIHILEQSGVGPSNARNEAVKAGSNPYIALLDSDDLWDVRKLKYLCEFIEKNSPKMIWSAFKMNLGVDFRTGFLENWSATALEHRWFRVYWCPLATSSLVFQRTVLEESGGWNEKIFMGEDTELNVRIIKEHSQDCHQINAYMGLYRRHENQTSFNEIHYHENLQQGLIWVNRSKVFDETFSELKKTSIDSYSETYWKDLYDHVQSHRIASDNPAESNWENYILMRVDGTPNGTKFKEKTAHLEDVMEDLNCLT